MSVKIGYLDNKIPVLMEKINNTSTVSLGVFIKTGAQEELPDESGLSHYIEHMMFKGTKKRSAKDISEIIDIEGGDINAYTGRRSTVYYIKMLHDKIDKGVDVLSDMFLNSTFTQENLDKERSVIIEEIKMYKDIPEDIVHDENIKYAIKGPQGNSVLGTEKSLNNISREKFLNYYKLMYKASNMVISVAGKIDYDQIFGLLNKTFGKIKDNSKIRKNDVSYKIVKGENIIKKDINQVHLCVNTRGTSLLDERKYTSSIISSVLGGGMSSRLFQKIREELGLAYSVYSYSSSFFEDGLFSVYAGTTKKDYRKVIDIIRKEFSDIREKGIEEKEFIKAKNQILSSLVFSMESSKNRMERMGNSYILYKKVQNIKEITEKIEKIKIEDIIDVAKYMFDENYYSLTVVGNVK
ncbi:M16 family metallopeptidase [Fusobacterium sp. PH5-44]|uniref:M16 family metallopeptidase n=1 Tax=unclassified Fusobacterium TaxID=2648384 RepID=UPI003D1F6AD7